eukprot:jgi/Psemu1/26035/gm1.26035_g
MSRTEANKTFVERLRRCPKLECNFWSRLNRSTKFDGDVSDITFEESDFWRNDKPSFLLLAAKRFENNLLQKKESSDAITTELYDEDRLIPSLSDPGSPRSSRSDSFEYAKPLCNLPSYEDVWEDEGPDYIDQKYDNIPNLGPINENDESFSTSSCGVISTCGNEPEKIANHGSSFETEETGECYERIVDASFASSSFYAPYNSTAFTYSTRSPACEIPQSYDCIRQPPEFIDVKTAKSLNLYVDKYPQTSFFSLLESLQSNRVVESIIVFRNPTTNEDRRTRSLEDMDNLFYIIHNLSKSLVELVLWNFHAEDLSSLRLGLANQSSIGHLQLHMEFGTLDQQLAESIASMPSLFSLQLEVNESFPVWALLRSEALAMLGVVSTRFDFESSDVLRLASNLRTNSALKVLQLEPHIPGWCVGSVMASLRFSHCTKLETFQFSCRNDDEEQGDACMAEVLKTIESETCLRVLWNHCYESFCVSEDVKLKTMTILSNNPSMQQFCVFVETED